MSALRTACLGLGSLCAALILAQPLPPPSNGLTIARLNSYPVINGRSPSGAVMSPDGKKIVYGWNKTGARKLDLWVMDYPSGRTRQILEAEKVEELPRQDDERTQLQKDESKEYDGGIGGGFQWSPDSKEILFSYHGRTWLVKPDGAELHPVFDTGEQVSSPAFSPDGRVLSFVRGQNLYRLDRATGAIKQLTFLSKGGTSLDGYYWSPDSKTIAVQWSATRNGGGSMMDFTQDRARVVGIGRMWNGEGGIDIQLGMIPAEGGIIKFAKDLPRYMWVTDVQWAPDSSRIGVYWISEDFQKASITLIDKEAGRRNIYQEKAPSNYIPDFRSLVWARDSRSLMFTTDIVDGQWSNRSLLSTDLWGLAVSKVYAESHDIAAVMRPKNSDRLIFVTQKRDPLITEITIKEPDGKITTHIPVQQGSATGNGFDEANLPLVSEDGTMIASLASDRKTNAEIYSIEPAMKRLTVSQTPEFEKVKWADYKLVEFPGPDGRIIHGCLITKPGLDITKKHPAVISDMYANSAKQSWGGYNANYMAMELDMVVLLVDFRASWGYGGEFNSGYYKNMGIIDVQEAVKAKEYLAGLGYVRPDRVGVWGWSYGGFLTCMIMLTDKGAFDTGVAVASVTDWKSYNEWYVRRRLGLPKDDPDIYKKTSPVHQAKGLEGNLLLIHGMLDDNVLYQDTVQLQENLIKEGKYFDVFSYPRGDHGMWRSYERPHIMTTIVTYLYNKLSRP